MPENYPEGADSICCDICDQWLHVSCSGLTCKKFKKLSEDLASKWYCKYCIEENFAFGKLGEIAFSDIINKTSINTIKTELSKLTIKSNFGIYCPLCNKKCTKSAIPCSACKNLTHQKCTKTNLRSFRNIQDITNWTCPKCIENTIPFYNVTNIELENLNLYPEAKNVNNTCDINDLNKLKSSYNFSNIFKSNDPRDKNSNQDMINCDYYDPNEFKNLLHTLPKNTFSICHANIRSIKANISKLQNLIINHNHLFDVISITETWDDKNKRNEFLPDLIDSYQPYNGIPGYSQNSGCGFYIRENINYADRNDLQ